VGGGGGDGGFEMSEYDFDEDSEEHVWGLTVADRKMACGGGGGGGGWCLLPASNGACEDGEEHVWADFASQTRLGGGESGGGSGGGGVFVH
jgi:hypothetical protein